MTRADFNRVERRRVVRQFQRYSHEQRMNRAASFRLYPGQRTAIGEFFYIHPDLPDVAFPTRRAALNAAWEVLTR